MIEAKPENLIGDRAYDSDPLDAELRKDGIEMIAPRRGNRSNDFEIGSWHFSTEDAHCSHGCVSCHRATRVAA
jgi:hypothetical protein